tara:strand:- start:488 stop:670 length:183 start_codon:yes stop_codon:yes gene_type:complete
MYTQRDDDIILTTAVNICIGDDGLKAQQIVQVVKELKKMPKEKLQEQVDYFYYTPQEELS